MTRIRFVLLALAGTVVTAAVVFAQRENVPGFATVARVEVLNRAADAVGVTIHDATVTLPITGSVNVATVANATVATRETRQAWEYRQLNVTAAQDVVDLLNKAGADGWEAVGTVPAAANSQSLILKRPR
jgi:hypothetical protein